VHGLPAALTDHAAENGAQNDLNCMGS